VRFLSATLAQFGFNCAKNQFVPRSWKLMAPLRFFTSAPCAHVRASSRPSFDSDGLSGEFLALSSFEIMLKQEKDVLELQASAHHANAQTEGGTNGW
jgi:hypothetical protein